MAHLLCRAQVLSPMDVYSCLCDLSDHTNGSTVLPNDCTNHVTRHKDPKEGRGGGGKGRGGEAEEEKRSWNYFPNREK